MDDADQIRQVEDRLRTAMLGSDVASLEQLLGPDMTFTDQAGNRLGKSDDIAAHGSGLLRIDRIDPKADASIRVIGDSAIVCVTVDLAGVYDDRPFVGVFAYTRLWHRSNRDDWRVEAAHCSSAAESL